MKKYYNYGVVVVLIAIPIVLFLLPPNYFDQGAVICPSKRFLDFECLGCGITRGIQHAIHFEFEEAWLFNKLTFVVLPVAFVYWLHLLFKYGLDKNILPSRGKK